MTDSVPQDDHVRKMDELAVQYGKPSGKLEVLSVGTVFAEVCLGPEALLFTHSNDGTGDPTCAQRREHQLAVPI